MSDQDSGISLRDHFAGQAVVAIVSTAATPCLSLPDGDAMLIARTAYKLADAMLEARQEQPLADSSGRSGIPRERVEAAILREEDGWRHLRQSGPVVLDALDNVRMYLGLSRPWVDETEKDQQS